VKTRALEDYDLRLPETFWSWFVEKVVEFLGLGCFEGQ